jgi:hypothetical protein
MLAAMTDVGKPDVPFSGREVLEPDEVTFVFKHLEALQAPFRKRKPV